MKTCRKTKGFLLCTINSTSHLRRDTKKVDHLRKYIEFMYVYFPKATQKRGTEKLPCQFPTQYKAKHPFYYYTNTNNDKVP